MVDKYFFKVGNYCHPKKTLSRCSTNLTLFCCFTAKKLKILILLQRKNFDAYFSQDTRKNSFMPVAWFRWIEDIEQR